VVDGPLLVSEALDAGVSIHSAFFESSIFDRDDEGVIVSQLEASGTAVHEVAPDSLRRVLDLGSPQSIAAVAHQSTTPLDEVLSASVAVGRPVIVAAGVADPGNAGTIIRTAEAAGCSGVVFTEGSVDVFNPKVVRATAGSIFRVPVGQGVADTELLEACIRHESIGRGSPGIPIVATVARDGLPPEEVDLSGSLVILVGSESHGIPDVLEGATTLRVTIPMEGAVESLNAGVSAALLAFEAARQRRLLN
jgi:TrmH family RNA methyltransferase